MEQFEHDIILFTEVTRCMNHFYNMLTENRQNYKYGQCNNVWLTVEATNNW